jgi:hypothetical protein
MPHLSSADGLRCGRRSSSGLSRSPLHLPTHAARARDWSSAAFTIEPAHTNNFAGATVTTLFVIDNGPSPDLLRTQGSANGAPVSPNTGTLFTVGPLGVDSGGRVGFDITSDNRAFASLRVPPGPTNPAQLYSINLNTGAATLIGAIPGDAIQAIAVAPASVPGPGTLTLLGFGVLGMLGYHRCLRGSRPALEQARALLNAPQRVE